MGVLTKIIIFAHMAIKRLYPNLVQAVVASLQRIFQKGDYADKVIQQTLKSNPKWGSRDRAFIAETTYDIVRWYRLLYEILGKRPVSEADWWLIVGILQLLQGNTLPKWREFQSLDAKRIRQREQELSRVRKIQESIPDWLDQLGAKELGSKWDPTIHALNDQAQVVLRANSLKTTPNALHKKLLEDGIQTKLLAGNALLVTERKNLFRTDAFRKGWFEVQDFSSQQVAPFVQAEPGLRIVDACAGAGGKTLHLAALMENKGQIIALDTEDWKLKELRRRVRRAGIAVVETRPITTTKVIKRLDQSADRVLLDVPCSGLGVLRRNPDAKWKLDLDFIHRIRETQQQIITAYSRMCKPGGALIYATCSILPSENQEQVQRFLKDKGNSFELEEERILLPQDEGFDGFYMARLRRRSNYTNS